MPHRRRSSCSRRRHRWPAIALLGVLAGCGPSAPERAADSTAPAASSPASGGEAPDPRLRALADSAARLDAAFRRLRDSLNAESRALASVDRRSPDYARRWDAFVVREREATLLRARRDSLRALVERGGAGTAARRAPARP